MVDVFPMTMAIASVRKIPINVMANAFVMLSSSLCFERPSTFCLKINSLSKHHGKSVQVRERTTDSAKESSAYCESEQSLIIRQAV